MTEERKKDVALALSSGGPRGFAYIGAIEELLRRGYRITSVAGSSIGSLVGGVYAAGKLEDFKVWLFSLNNFKLMRLLDFSISRSYLLKGQKVIDTIKSIVPDVRIEDMGIPFAAIATDLYTGEPVVFNRGNLFNAVRASISIPSMFRPAKNTYRTLIDGGLASTFPLGYVARNGHDILVGFDVNSINVKEISSFLKAGYKQRKANQAFNELSRDTVSRVGHNKALSLLEKVKFIGGEGQKYLKARMKEEKIKDPLEADDNYFSILTRSFSIANHTIARLETEMYRPDILVKMPLDSYGSIPDYAKAPEISDKGRELMARALDEYENGTGSPGK